ncbi:MAG TPA: hypothetical protein PLE74_00950 [Candidatus Cloacimonadota bacterium]|nr:hypothetical protein [Candidatus Cloacimonadota bacterium]
MEKLIELHTMYCLDAIVDGDFKSYKKSYLYLAELSRKFTKLHKFIVMILESLEERRMA